MSSEEYFYFKKCLEIRHDFFVLFWDIYLQVLTHFGPFLIIFRSFLWRKSSSWVSRNDYCRLKKCLTIFVSSGCASQNALQFQFLSHYSNFTLFDSLSECLLGLCVVPGVVRSYCCRPHTSWSSVTPFDRGRNWTTKEMKENCDQTSEVIFHCTTK